MSMEQETDGSNCESYDSAECRRIDERSSENPRAALAGLHKDCCAVCSRAEVKCACASKVFKMSIDAAPIANDPANDCGVCRDGQDGFMVGCESCDGWFHGACVDVTVDMVDNIKTYYCLGCQERYPHLKIHYYTTVDLKVSAPTTPPSARNGFDVSSVPEKAVARISVSNSIRSAGRPKHSSKNKRYRNNGFSFTDRIDRSYKHNGRDKIVTENLPPKRVRSRSGNSFPQDGRVDLREPEHNLESEESLRKHPKINKTAGASERHHFHDPSQHREMNVARTDVPVKPGSRTHRKVPLSMTLMPPFCTLTDAFSDDGAENEPVQAEPAKLVFMGRSHLKFPALDDPLFNTPDTKNFLHKASHADAKVLAQITAHFADLKLQEEVKFVLQAQLAQPPVSQN